MEGWRGSGPPELASRRVCAVGCGCTCRVSKCAGRIGSSGHACASVGGAVSEIWTQACDQRQAGARGDHERGTAVRKLCRRRARRSGGGVQVTRNRRRGLWVLTVWSACARAVRGRCRRRGMRWIRRRQGQGSAGSLCRQLVGRGCVARRAARCGCEKAGTQQNTSVEGGHALRAGTTALARSAPE
jgi:hypothetical protein